MYCHCSSVSMQQRLLQGKGKSLLSVIRRIFEIAGMFNEK